MTSYNLFYIFFFIFLGDMFFCVFDIERLKKKAVEAIYMKIGKEGLERVILENAKKEKPNVAVIEIERIRADLLGRDVVQLKRIILNKVLANMSWGNFLLAIFGGTLGFLPRIIVIKHISKPLPSFTKTLFLEEIVKKENILKDFYLMDKKLQGKRRFHYIVLSLSFIGSLTSYFIWILFQ